MVSQAPPHRSGAVTGLTTTARMTGQTIGVALTALVFSAGGGTGSHDVRVVLWVSVGLSLVALGISSLRIESVREMRREGRAGPWT